MSNQKTSKGIHNVTSLPGSAGGATPSDLPAGRTIGQSGRVHPPANPLAWQDYKKGKTMNDTSRHGGSNLSASADLQSSLESRLKQQLERTGSTIYKTTWKQKTTPAGRSYWELRASAPRTSGKGSGSSPSGWVTPSTRDWKDSPGMATTSTNKDGTVRNRIDQLPRQAAQAGWATPNTMDHMNLRPKQAMYDMASKGQRKGRTFPANLREQVSPEMIQCYLDAKADLKDGSVQEEYHPTMEGLVPMRFTVSGQMLTGLAAEMESGGLLNPELSRWLMGLPKEWDACVPTETQLCRK